MKRILALAFLAASLISMGSTRAHAQTFEAKVPFDFVLQNRMLPAGTYQISRASQNGILFQSRDGHFHVVSTTYVADGLPPSEGRLVFKKYGNHYFLHEVLCNGAQMNDAIPESNLEKRFSVEVAQLATTRTVAVVRSGEK